MVEAKCWLARKCIAQGGQQSPPALALFFFMSPNRYTKKANESLEKEIYMG